MYAWTFIELLRSFAATSWLSLLGFYLIIVHKHIRSLANILVCLKKHSSSMSLFILLLLLPYVCHFRSLHFPFHKHSHILSPHPLARSFVLSQLFLVECLFTRKIKEIFFMCDTKWLLYNAESKRMWHSSVYPCVITRWWTQKWMKMDF